jgi:hypothetical protein
VFGLGTCAVLPIALDANFITPILGGHVDYTPSSVPIMRHWGIMIFGIGALMVVAAFRPWLRFETMLFSTVEKAFMVFLFLSNLGQPWVMGYVGPAVIDSAIVLYSLFHFISDEGRPQRWIAKRTLDDKRRISLKTFAL